VGARSVSAWGAAQTRFFYELTPDRILDAVDAAGFRTTGRCNALNSMENRVYEVEVEVEEPVRTVSDRYRIVKFYRPGRWSDEQIRAEHEFLRDLVEHEIPVAAPLALSDDSSLAVLPELGIRYAIWPRVGGRVPDELDDRQIEQFGRLMARVHEVGAMRSAAARVRLDPATYGLANLEYLLEADVLPAQVRDVYRALVEQLCALVEPWFARVDYQRIHGDCHLGNVLWTDKGAFLVDFDDMVQGPCVQDLWLVVLGRDAHALHQREQLVQGYEQMRPFDHLSLRLIEPLRALRLIHFAAWIARRWEDPAFKRVFSDYGTERYWFDQVTSLREQLAYAQESVWS